MQLSSPERLAFGYIPGQQIVIHPAVDTYTYPKAFRLQCLVRTIREPELVIALEGRKMNFSCPSLMDLGKG